MQSLSIGCSTKEMTVVLLCSLVVKTNPLLLEVIWEISNFLFVFLFTQESLSVIFLSENSLSVNFLKLSKLSFCKSSIIVVILKASIIYTF